MLKISRFVSEYHYTCEQDTPQTYLGFTNPVVEERFYGFGNPTTEQTEAPGGRMNHLE